MWFFCRHQHPLHSGFVLHVNGWRRGSTPGLRRCKNPCLAGRSEPQRILHAHKKGNKGFHGVCPSHFSSYHALGDTNRESTAESVSRCRFPLWAPFVLASRKQKTRKTSLPSFILTLFCTTFGQNWYSALMPHPFHVTFSWNLFILKPQVWGQFKPWICQIPLHTHCFPSISDHRATYCGRFGQLRALICTQLPVSPAACHREKTLHDVAPKHTESSIVSARICVCVCRKQLYSTFFQRWPVTLNPVNCDPIMSVSYAAE